MITGHQPKASGEPRGEPPSGGSSGVKPAESQDIEFKIARLELRPGDVLVVRTKQRLSRAQIDRLADLIKPAIGSHRCLILDSDTDLAVLTPAEIEARLS